MKSRLPSLPMLWLSILALPIALAIFSPIFGQDQASKPSKTPEMLISAEGLLAIETPKGWFRTDGPGLAFFLRKGDNKQTTKVWIYINSGPVGPKAEARDMNSYIDSDIAGFKERFAKGSVQKESPLELPIAKMQAPVFTFRSNEAHNPFEQVVYIPESGRVLMLVLSAKTKDALTQALPSFEEFAKSYRGSIILGSQEKRP